MEENFVRKKLPHTYRIFYEVLPVFEWTNNSVSQTSSPVRRLTVLASFLVTAQPLRQTWIRLPPTGTTTSPPLSLQGSLLILLPSLQSTLSPFLFFTPVSSFSATPRGNDCLMHENGKEFSGAQKINQKNSCMLEFCMRCLEETAALYTFGERKGIPVRCFWTYIHSCDLVFISASFFLKHNRTILSKWQHKMLL